MCIGESESLFGECVDVWCGYFGFGVVALDIAVAEVVGEDEEDVGEFGGWGGESWLG